MRVRRQAEYPECAACELGPPKGSSTTMLSPSTAGPFGVKFGGQRQYKIALLAGGRFKNVMGWLSVSFLRFLLFFCQTIISSTFRISDRAFLGA